MTNVIIVYTSMTGNTEEIAEAVQSKLVTKDANVTFVPAEDISAEELVNFDKIVVATYTYGQGELPDDIQDFYDDLKNIDLAGKGFGVIGSGDTSYDELFCKAAVLFEELLLSIGGVKAANTLKIEFNEFDNDQIETFVEDLLK
jgi:flavodoxin short chain